MDESNVVLSEAVKMVVVLGFMRLGTVRGQRLALGRDRESGGTASIFMRRGGLGSWQTARSGAAMDSSMESGVDTG